MSKSYTSSHCIPWLGFDKFQKILYSLDFSGYCEENGADSTRTINPKFTIRKCTPFLWEKIADCKILGLKNVPSGSFSCCTSQCGSFVATILFDVRPDREDHFWLINVETGGTEKVKVERNIDGDGGEIMKAKKIEDRRLLLHSISFGWIVIEGKRIPTISAKNRLKNLVIYNVVKTERKKICRWRRIATNIKNRNYCTATTVGNSVFCLRNFLEGWDVYDLVTNSWSEIDCSCSLSHSLLDKHDWTAVLTNDEFYIVANVQSSDNIPILKLDKCLEKIQPTQLRLPFIVFDSYRTRNCMWMAAGASGLIVTPSHFGSLKQEWFGAIARISLASLQDRAFECVMLLCPVKVNDLDYFKKLDLPEIITRIYFGPKWTVEKQVSKRVDTFL